MGEKYRGEEVVKFGVRLNFFIVMGFWVVNLIF